MWGLNDTMTAKPVCGRDHVPFAMRQRIKQGAPTANPPLGHLYLDLAQRTKQPGLETNFSFEGCFFKTVLEEGQETAGVCTVNDAVVVGQCEVGQ